MSMQVKQIEAKDTYHIRQQVLRSGGPIELCYFDGDKDSVTFHLGAFVDDTLASIASFYLKKHEHFSKDYQFQLRGMATLPEFQGKGLSSALLRTAFPLIKKNHVNMLWCNARSEAKGFYQKVGFTVESDEFNIEGIGPHYLMAKRF